jgi:hypothetical protein
VTEITAISTRRGRDGRFFWRDFDSGATRRRSDH